MIWFSQGLTPKGESYSFKHNRKNVEEVTQDKFQPWLNYNWIRPDDWKPTRLIYKKTLEATVLVSKWKRLTARTNPENDSVSSPFEKKTNPDQICLKDWWWKGLLSEYALKKQRMDIQICAPGLPKLEVIRTET